MQIVKMQFGSQVYGTNLPTSDKDYKGIFLPSPREIILGSAADVIQDNTKVDITKKSTADDIEMENFSLKKYIKLLTDSQTTPVGMLFVPSKWYQEEPSLIWQQILDNKDKFLSSGVSAFVGYCRTQANKYGIKGSRMNTCKAIVDLLNELINIDGATAKLNHNWDKIEDFVNYGKYQHCSILKEKMRNSDKEVRMLEVCNRKAQEFVTLKEAHSIFNRVYQEYGHRAIQAQNNENIDWKALMHACRVYNETRELLTTGKITYPRPEAPLLLDIRLGKIKYNWVAEYLENGLEELETLVEKSVLRNQPDRKFAEDFIFNTYHQWVLQ